MRAVNFIADPWDSPEPLSYRDNQWQRNYASFRTRMHWLLLWYDEVWIQDTYAICPSAIWIILCVVLDP